MQTLLNKYRIHIFLVLVSLCSIFKKGSVFWKIVITSCIFMYNALCPSQFFQKYQKPSERLKKKLLAESPPTPSIPYLQSQTDSITCALLGYLPTLILVSWNTSGKNITKGGTVGIMGFNTEQEKSCVMCERERKYQIISPGSMASMLRMTALTVPSFPVRMFGNTGKVWMVSLHELFLLQCLLKQNKIEPKIINTVKYKFSK